MGLTSRILVTTLAVVVVSLAISGGLTFVLVRQLEQQSAQQQLDQLALGQRSRLLQLECANIPDTGITCTGSKFATPTDYVDRLEAVAASLPIDRVLLVTTTGKIVFDSSELEPSTISIPTSQHTTIAGLQIVHAPFQLTGNQYFSSGLTLRPRDPLGARYLLLARAESGLVVSAAGRLTPTLIAPAAVALLLALALSVIIARRLTRDLRQLRLATEDLGAGNYGRRVRVLHDDEVGAVAKSFNAMASAIQSTWNAQRDFLANASHELKTPLTSLIGFSQALSDGSLQTDGEKALAATIIHEEAQRLLRISVQLLDLSRIEGGQVSINWTIVDLHDQLESEVHQWKSFAANRNIMIELKPQPDDGNRYKVLTDPDLIHQILTNLFDNGSRYAPSGTNIDVVLKSDKNDVTVIMANRVVAPLPDPRRIFERFYRADGSRSASSGGTGLGLAISRQLATILRINLEARLSDSEDSIIFELSLPRHRGQMVDLPRATNSMVTRNP